MSEPDDQGPWAITAMVLFYLLGGAVFAVLPLLVGASVDLLGFTAKQAGLIGGADMFGATLSALIVSLIVPRGRWRSLIYLGALILTLANVVSGLAQHFPALLVSRVVAGLGAGVILTIATVSIAETRNPDRVYGLAAAALVAYGSPALFLMPALLGAHGLRGVFWFLAGLTAVVAPLARNMPNAARSGQTSTPAAVKVSVSTASVVGLAGMFTYFMAQGGVWAFLDRIGTTHHIDAPSVGTALALSAIAGLCGALLASWLDVRYGRLKPLVLAAVGTAVALLTLSDSAVFAVFIAMTALFNFCWNVSIPYQLGALAQIDSSRRTVALSGVLSNAGLASGPMLAATIISDNSVQNVIWMGLTLTGLSLLLFAWILTRMEPAARAAENQ